MAKTVQIGLRIDKALLEEIEFYSKKEGVEKMAWIRRALSLFVGDVENAVTDEAISDYINLRINEKELKDTAKFEKIPSDLKQARAEVLESLKGGSKK